MASYKIKLFRELETSRKIMSFVAVLIVVNLFLSCSGKKSSSQNPRDYSDALIILPNATNVHYTKLQGTDQVVYNLKVNYPATDIINNILKQLHLKGWQPLKEDFLNPGLPTSYIRGWTNFVDATKNPQREVYLWMSDWKNNKSDIVRYSFKYEYPINGPKNLSSLQVIVIYTPASIKLG